MTFQSQLVEGFIPPHTNCPFKHKCQLSEYEACYHEGENHKEKFSCGVARGFDLIQRIRFEHGHTD